MRKRLAVVLVLAAFGCGSSSKETKSEGTTTAQKHSDESATAVDPNAISPEKFDEIAEFFRRKSAQVQFNCYNSEVEKTGQKYEGNVSFSMVVQPGGKVSDVKVTGSTLKSPGIEQCIVDAMQAWEWPDVPGPAPYTGSLNFKPAW